MMLCSGKIERTSAIRKKKSWRFWKILRNGKDIELGSMPDEAIW